MNEKKFIVGNWYKSEWGNYFKFRELKYNNFSSSEDHSQLINLLNDVL